MPPSQSSKLSPAAVIGPGRVGLAVAVFLDRLGVEVTLGARSDRGRERAAAAGLTVTDPTEATRGASLVLLTDRRSTRLNSSHLGISYAVFCLKKKKKTPEYTEHTTTL